MSLEGFVSPLSVYRYHERLVARLSPQPIYANGWVVAYPKTSPYDRFIVSMVGNHPLLAVSTLGFPTTPRKATEMKECVLSALAGEKNVIVDSEILFLMDHGPGICRNRKARDIVHRLCGLRRDERRAKENPDLHYQLFGIAEKIRRILSEIGDHPDTCNPCRWALKRSEFAVQYYCPPLLRLLQQHH